MISIFIFSLYYIYGFAGLGGAQNMNLTLTDCIDLAKEQSPAAGIAKKNYDFSHWQYRAFRASLLPQVYLSMESPRLNRAINPILRDDGTTSFIRQSEAFSSLNLSVSQEIPWTGGQIIASTAIQRIDIFGNVRSYLWRSSPLMIQLRQPLFQFNEVAWNRRLENLQYKVAKRRYVEALEQAAVDITGRFFDLYIAQINLENARFNLSVNDTIYQISQGRYNVGKIAENDLLQSELKLMDARTQLSAARLACRRAEQDLKIALGLAEAVTVTLVAPSDIPDFRIDPDWAVEQARRNRSDFLDYQYERLTARRDVDRARSDSRFSALMTASFGYNQSADKVPDLYEDPMDQQAFNVNFQIPLFTWGRGGASVDAAVAREQEVRKSTALDEEQFIQQVYFQALEVMQLQEQVRLAARADTIARRRFEVTKNRYLIGKIDITNMFIAQNEKDAARRNYIQTLRRYWTAYYNLRRITLYDFENKQLLFNDTFQTN